MKTVIAAAALAVGLMGVTTGAAEARHWHHGGWHHHRVCSGWGWHHHHRMCRGWRG